VIPVRDGSRTLRQAVESALDDSLPMDEIVVVDDGSIDHPERVLPCDSRLRVIKQSKKGIVAALERGRGAAKREYIARLDADDVVLPGRLQAQLDALVADPHLAAVGGQALIEPLDGPLAEGMVRYVEWVNGLEDLHREILVESPLFHPAVTMRASALEDVGGYRSGDLPEDYDLWLRLVANGWRIRNVAQPVVRIRDRPDRLTRTDARYRRAAFRGCKMEWLGQHWKDGPLEIAVWGGGRCGRHWTRWVEERGHTLALVVDPFQVGKTRLGHRVQAPDALQRIPVDRLIVAVGARGAREEIRAALASLQPEWVEGHHWFAVA